MTPPDDADRFSSRLDDEWLRARLRTQLDADTLPEDDLVRAIEEADPLGAPARPRWRESLALAFAPWPARVGVGLAVAALLVLGFALGRVVNPSGQATIVSTLPPIPAYVPAPSAGLGIAPPVNPRAEERFRAAMAFHGSPDFARKALPLLREAVALDPSHDRAQLWLGVASVHTDQPQEAVGALEQAVRLAPADAVARSYLAFAYLRLAERIRARP